jgi:hypothetical protein
VLVSQDLGPIAQFDKATMLARLKPDGAIFHSSRAGLGRRRRGSSRDPKIESWPSPFRPPYLKLAASGQMDRNQDADLK